MPRIVIKGTPRSPQFERFVKLLLDELRHPGDGPQPLILEEEISSTGSHHVHVIWDKWKKLSQEERSDIIDEAYLQAEGKEFADQITIASGLTAREALALGLLPWKIEPAERSKNGDQDPGRALLEEEKNTVLGSGSVKAGYGLRYPRKEDADAAAKRLQAKFPNLAWHISKEMYSED